MKIPDRNNKRVSTATRARMSFIELLLFGITSIKSDQVFFFQPDLKRLIKLSAKTNWKTTMNRVDHILKSGVYMVRMEFTVKTLAAKMIKRFRSKAAIYLIRIFLFFMGASSQNVLGSDMYNSKRRVFSGSVSGFVNPSGTVSKRTVSTAMSSGE